MNRTKYIFLLLISSLVTTSLCTAAGVDKESIFSEARRPASELDARLSFAEEVLWRGFFGSSDDGMRENYPLITQGGVKIDLHYFGNDHIKATGWITKLDGFLELSAGDRKKLVLNTLGLVRAALLLKVNIVDKKTGVETGATIDNHHIQLAMIISNIFEDDTGAYIQVPAGPSPWLPLDIGIGSAGYVDGQFVFSEPFFLDLKVQEGLAESGGPDKFIIEREK